jgi:hypothetical protein
MEPEAASKCRLDVVFTTRWRTSSTFFFVVAAAAAAIPEGWTVLGCAFKAETAVGSNVTSLSITQTISPLLSRNRTYKKDTTSNK